MKNLVSFLFLFLILHFGLFAQKNMQFLGQLKYDVRLSDVWGHVDSTGREYAIVGLYNGVSVVDVTDPAKPDEVYFEPGPATTWRDMKTWKGHAYITNQKSGGLKIIDLSSLPDTSGITVTSYTGGGLAKAHNLFIDTTNGTAYVFGANIGNGGAVILDLTDPKAPVELGQFTDFYLHDGMVRGDTLWGGAVYKGQLAVIDVTDKAKPTLLAVQETPNAFTHNCWISDNGKSVFTTDERTNAYVTSYDVSDLSDIRELDRIKPNPDSVRMPHNVHVLDDYLITSYYVEGVIVIDALRPHNLVITGHYDTAPGKDGGSGRCWGAYPWLPSGHILASDVVNGLFILGADYQRACYLEGTITDMDNGNSINNVSVEMLGADIQTDFSRTNGFYATGIADSGTYKVRFYKIGYLPDTITVHLQKGLVVEQDIQLKKMPPFKLHIKAINEFSEPVDNAYVYVVNDDFSFTKMSNTGGVVSIDTFYAGAYTITAGKWGFELLCSQTYDILPGDTLELVFEKGYYDDFTLDFNWSTLDDDATGSWERVVPQDAYHNNILVHPGSDVLPDCGGLAFVTGNVDVTPNSNNVNEGISKLVSPPFDLSDYNNPYVSYYRWFFTGGGTEPSNDSMVVSLTNGTSTAILEIINNETDTFPAWTYRAFRIKDYIELSDSMHLIFQIEDKLPNHIVEGAVDLFRINDLNNSSIRDNEREEGLVKVFPNPFQNTFTLQIDKYRFGEGYVMEVYDMTGNMVLIKDLQQRSYRINFDHFQAGLYFLKIKSVSGTELKPVKILKIN